MFRILRFFSKTRLLFSILFYAIFSFLDIYFLILNQYEINVNLSQLTPKFFFLLFIIFTASYFNAKITKAESINFLSLLWRLFMTGLVTTLLILGIRFFIFSLGTSALGQNLLMINILYHVIVPLVVVYLIASIIVFKRLILYQKSKKLLKFWLLFRYIFLGTLVFDLLGNTFLSFLYTNVLVFISAFILILSLNLKWIAYLNFKQKLKSIFYLLITGIYLYHFLTTLLSFRKSSDLIFDVFDNVFIMGMFIFSACYTCISILVILFNLPTSSVFERKLKESVDFQKLSQAIPRGQTEDQTYDILLESSMSAVFADAAWLEIRNPDFPDGIYYLREVNHQQISFLKEQLPDGPIKNIINFNTEKLLSSSQLIGSVKKGDFKSVMAMPVIVKGNQLGTLVLLHEMSDAFNIDLIDIVVTFVNQASISIENFLLISDALETERYKEQLKIAKEVQEGLLPKELIKSEAFDVCAISESAEEVGGDYYDLLQLDEGLYGLIIGDVSGKGTSAAFHMAQMKGIFHTLVLKNISTREFVKNANLALSQCLEKSSFITASYFKIDSKFHKIEFSRAGHVPALLYQTETKSILELTDKGMGFGILRNNEYDNYVNSKKLTYNKHDILLLYTDGITESRNKQNQLFGHKRLKASLAKYVHNTPEQIKDGIIQDLKDFLQEIPLDDDYTLVIVKFN